MSKQALLRKLRELANEKKAKRKSTPSGIIARNKRRKIWHRRHNIPEMIGVIDRHGIKPVITALAEELNDYSYRGFANYFLSCLEEFDRRIKTLEIDALEKWQHDEIRENLKKEKT